MLRLLVASIFFISLQAAGDNCPELPQSIETAIFKHINKIRAYEYCDARLIESSHNRTIVIYTAEGECNESTEQPPGSCSNNWARYMIGEYSGRLIAPVLIGGKGNFTDHEIMSTGNEIKISGVTVGSEDGLCCPTVPQTKAFRVADNGFEEFFP